MPYCNLWPAQLYNIFPHYLTNGMISEKKLLNIKYVFWFYLQLLSVTYLILRRPEQNINKNVYWSPCKVSVITVRFKWNSNFLYRFFKNTQISNVMKIHSVGAELFHAVRHDEANVTFRNFANMPKNMSKQYWLIIPNLMCTPSFVNRFNFSHF